MIKRFLQAESPTLFIFISSSPTSKVRNTINLFAKPIRSIKSTSIQTNWWPTISSKTITVWTFHWRSYSPIRIWGQRSREIYFGIIQKFTSNCLKRKDSGNVTGKNSRTIFGDSTILSIENLKILGINKHISPVNCYNYYLEPADWSFFSRCNQISCQIF